MSFTPPKYFYSYPVYRDAGGLFWYSTPTSMAFPAENLSISDQVAKIQSGFTLAEDQYGKTFLIKYMYWIGFDPRVETYEESQIRKEQDYQEQLRREAEAKRQAEISSRKAMMSFLQDKFKMLYLKWRSEPTDENKSEYEKVGIQYDQLIIYANIMPGTYGKWPTTQDMIKEMFPHEITKIGIPTKPVVEESPVSKGQLAVEKPVTSSVMMTSDLPGVVEEKKQETNKAAILLLLGTAGWLMLRE